MQRLAYAAMLFNIIAWGMSWVSVRTVLTELDAGQVGALRYLIASAVMLPVWLYRGRPLPDKSDLGLVSLLGLFGFCLYNLGINFGEKTVDAGTGSLLISFQPILVIVIGVLLRREVVSPPHVVPATIPSAAPARMPTRGTPTREAGDDVVVAGAPPPAPHPFASRPRRRSNVLVPLLVLTLVAIATAAVFFLAAR